MGSGSTAGVPAEQLGIVPRIVSQVFDELESTPADGDWSVRVSYLEIYNEELKDLLHPRTPVKSISIREDRAGDIFVHGVQEAEVCSREELLRCVEAGSASRTTRATLMNEMSSRSHSLFTIMIERRAGPQSDVVTSKFHLVDLAGSERNKKTGTAGARFKESVTINQGLLALGNVISALGDESRRTSLHVPYRESKLTRLLQDSLGGNSHTLMIACVGPADSNLDETLQTLRYANRARNIRNTPIINREAPSVGDLRHEIESLQWQLQQHQQQSTPSAGPSAAGSQPATDDGVPLSRRVLQVLRTELPAQQMERLVHTLASIDAAAASVATTPESSPMVTPTASPMRAISGRDPRTPPRVGSALSRAGTYPLSHTDASTAQRGAAAALGRDPASKSSRQSPLQHLRHTLQQWGRAEAQRAQLVGQLPQPQPSSDAGSGGGETTEGVLSVQGAMRRAAERGQLMQALAVQQLEAFEAELAEREQEGRDALGGGARPSTAPAAGQLLDAERLEGGRTPTAERTALRAMLAVRERELAEARSELSEAKADLSRDEQIFADKLRELKRLSKAHALLQREHAALQQQSSSSVPQPQLESQRGSTPPSAPLTPPPSSMRGAAKELSWHSATPLRNSTPAWEATTPCSEISTCGPASPPTQSPRHGATPGSEVPTPENAGAAAAAADPAEMSTRLACSPSRAFADELEALDEVLLDDGDTGRDYGDRAGGSDALGASLGAARGGRTMPLGQQLEKERAQLDEQRAQLVKDQHELRTQYSAAEAQTQAQTMHFEEQQHRLEASVRDLTLNIRLKEELIRDLSRSEEESRSVVGTYQQKLHEMSSEISQLQDELSRTRGEMESAERQADRSEEEKQRLRLDYERKLRETDAHLAEVRRRQKEQERALKSRELAERKMADLRAEVERMRNQEGSVREAIKGSRQQHEQRQAAREKEVSGLRKQMEESARRVRALEQVTARQEQQLQRKSEQVSAAQHRLRLAQGGTASDKAAARAARRGTPTRVAVGGPGSAGSSAVASRVSSRPSTAEAPAGTAAFEQPQGGSVDAQVQAETTALEQQEEELLRRNEAARALELELGRRESILREKEALLASREAKEAQVRKGEEQLRASNTLRLSISSLSRQLREVDGKIAQETAPRGGEKGPSALSGEAEALLRERTRVQDQLARLEERGEVGGGALLDEAARVELRELDERVESLSLQLDVKNSAISELEEQALAELEAAPEGELLRAQLNHMSLPVARRVLQANAHRTLQLREQQRAREKELESLRIQLAERAEESASLRQTLGQVVSEHERQLEEQQRQLKAQVREHVEAEARSPPSGGARRWLATGSPMATGDAEEPSPQETIEQLGRDNFYYKVCVREDPRIPLEPLLI